MATKNPPSDGPPRAKALLGDLYDWGVMDEREGEDDHRDAHIGQILRALHSDLKAAMPKTEDASNGVASEYKQGWNAYQREVQRVLDEYFGVDEKLKPIPNFAGFLIFKGLYFLIVMF